MEKEKMEQEQQKGMTSPTEWRYLDLKPENGEIFISRFEEARGGEEAEELVSKLSGGQRKRLSIAVEFVASPDLFILDEPDSGLDGVMARELMEYLRQIADDRKIVMVITHTPDRVIDLFDKVIVLAKSTGDHVGHLAFYGGVEEARSFFGKDSMEEILLLMNSKEEGGQGLADAYIEKFRQLTKSQGPAEASVDPKREESQIEEDV